MDPLTQGLLGAAATQAVLGHRLGKRAWLIGAVGGMAADLDVLIRSPDDPLLGWRFHRHFTHSLAFIPVGGVLASLPWTLRKRNADRRRELVLGTTVGYATHALLDAFTSYGTMLWWPFSHARVAWSSVAIVDPLYTGILALGVILAARRLSRRPARLALLLSSLYLLLGFVQRSRALDTAREAAAERGHAIERIEAIPSPPTNLMWRTLYVSGDRIWVDRVRAPWWSPAVLTVGGSVPLVTESELPPAVHDDPRTAEAFAVYRWFTSGWVGRDPDDPEVLGDMRYGVLEADVHAMRGLVLRPGTPTPVSSHRAQMGDALAERWRNLWGESR